MAPRKQKKEPKRPAGNLSAVIENAGVMVEQPIASTLEKNYMPYAMSVIVSRAIPEIDGLKPSHRKLLYTRQFMKPWYVWHGDVKPCCILMWTAKAISARHTAVIWLMRLPAIQK